MPIAYVEEKTTTTLISKQTLIAKVRNHLRTFAGLPSLGLATEFRSEKIPRNRLGMVSVIPRKKVLIPRSTEESIPKLGTEISRKNHFKKHLK
jgi:hypothetical protein